MVLLTSPVNSIAKYISLSIIQPKLGHFVGNLNLTDKMHDGPVSCSGQHHTFVSYLRVFQKFVMLRLFGQ